MSINVLVVVDGELNGGETTTTCRQRLSEVAGGVGNSRGYALKERAKGQNT